MVAIYMNGRNDMFLNLFEPAHPNISKIIPRSRSRGRDLFQHGCRHKPQATVYRYFNTEAVQGARSGCMTRSAKEHAGATRKKRNLTAVFVFSKKTRATHLFVAGLLGRGGRRMPRGLAAAVLARGGPGGGGALGTVGGRRRTIRCRRHAKERTPTAARVWVDTFEASWKGEGVPESMSQRDAEGRMEQWCRGESSAVFGGDGRRGRECGCERRGAWCEQRAK